MEISAENYRQLAQKSMVGICVCHGETVVFANQRLADMLGYPADALDGMVVWDLFHDEDGERVRALAAGRDLALDTELHYECRMVRHDGSVLWADVSSDTMFFLGKSATLINAYNITRGKEAEQRQEELAELAQRQQEQLVHSTRLAEMGEIAAGVAHELNQPLTGIRNFARNAFYMLDHHVGSEEEVKDNLRLISDQVDRASKIITQMRELSRRQDKHFKRVSINDIIHESLDFLGHQLDAADVTVQLDLADAIPPFMADRVRLEQVFLNLVTNARQAMEETEERRLTLSSRYEPGHALPVMVCLKDTGRGFDQVESERMFAPFYTTKKPGQGTGLGLSISLTIIEEHGGTIEAAGAPGQGAVFTIRLPLQTEAQPDKE